jgi:hypothetical protein
MIDVDAATVLLMWATGGIAFGWVTSRHRLVSLGYGWTFRGAFGGIAILAAVVGIRGGTNVVRDGAALAMAALAAVATWVSWQRRGAGVRGQRAVVERRSARVAAMTGIDREEQRFDKAAPEYPPNLDLVAAAVGMVGLLAGAVAAEGPAWLALVRAVVGALFLGAITDAMLLGHWYLTQPGLPRAPIVELVRWSGWLWLPQLVVFLLPTGMVSVLNGSIDDGYNGLLGWFWVACVITTIVLVFVTLAALRERQYAAVMAATGLMYLAILTGFGMDLVARILLDA